MNVEGGRQGIMDGVPTAPGTKSMQNCVIDTQLHNGFL